MIEPVSLKELHEAYLRCRIVGHSWDDFPAATRVGTVFAWQENYRCTRCSTERYDAIGVTGVVLQRAYVYPEGYKLAGQVKRAEFRVEMRSRRTSRRKRQAW